MKLTGLTLYHFRNYEELHLALHPGVNLLVGENAQGKTNLLEAVFYLSTGGSFRTGRAQELIGFGAESMLESMPPDRKVHTGTSEIICLFIASSTRKRV